MKQRNQAKAEPLVVVVAFMRTEKPPKWKVVCEPTARASALLVVQEQWKLGHPARIIAAPISNAA
ncbi:hypothetical protein [Bradyrhizobium elkanii]|uniref:hypothetical protein n=1 Tax=Bradyrhizobium elkanii TaxID=29448 RepID=UPI001448FA2B|nr:hypothetical protein [Bradyrhizobium elkanii]MCP1932219.1 hypothetical protein [Bradyrhizobium elkanii]MCS3577241.1 hypothetical protein [Bradyrhizobium elkanii]MCS3720118.1 hypothetical protein [Bradyrhizobium elkanii]MCS4004535.1 hypothetical protein [Bradyrhizobium elkanii USDA 61]WLA44004.1 hypothetical protein QNJ95_22275 [Bradyrhizobium elkanii]